MDVSQAVASRRSVRAFLPDPVDPAILRQLMEKAQRSPSGGNVQPWNAAVISGEPLARVKAAVAEIFPQGRKAHSPEYDIYPPQMDGIYAERSVQVGEVMYAALGIERNNNKARFSQFAVNFRAFDAPVLMLVHCPDYMGRPQFSDIGMWLQSVMLLLREAGLDSCAQEAWALYHQQIRAEVSIPDDHIFFCGLAIGYRDPDAPINNFSVPRASIAEAIRFEGF